MIQSSIDLASEALSNHWSTSDASNLSTRLSNAMSQSNHCPHFSFDLRCSVAFSLPVSLLSMAFGGLTAWWLLQSNKADVLKDLGSKATTCALTSTNIIEDIVVKFSDLLNRSNNRVALRGFDASLPASSMRMISSQYSFEDASCLKNTSRGNCTRQSSQSEIVVPEAVTSSEVSSPRERFKDNLVGNAPPPKYSLLGSEQQHQLIEAVMLGDEAFVASALQRSGPESLDEYGTDEYGNSLLILAVQVLPRSPSTKIQ